MNSTVSKGIAVTVLALMLPAAALAAEGSFDRRLSVKGPVLLSIETGSGYIHVQPGASNEVHIVAHVHAGNGWGSGGSADDRVKQVVANPPITQTGNIISIGKQMTVHNVSIDYDVTTPRGTDLRADTGSGDIHIEDNGGPVEAQTGSGSIDATGLSDHVNLHTGSGDIKAAMLSSLDVKAQTGSGSIQLKNVQGALWAQTGSGDLDISGRPASAWKVETGSGSVNLAVGSAPFSLDAETGSGDVKTAMQLSSTNSDKHHVIGTVGGGGPRLRVVSGSGDISIH
jgi:DUF4097 and DUF4098 domain-containing protein YvlB